MLSLNGVPLSGYVLCVRWQTVASELSVDGLRHGGMDMLLSRQCAGKIARADSWFLVRQLNTLLAKRGFTEDHVRLEEKGEPRNGRLQPW